MNTQKNSENTDTISILDLLIVIFKNKKLIFIMTFVFFVIILGINVLGKVFPAKSSLNILPDYYQPEVQVLLKLPSGSGGLASSILGSGDSSSLIGLFGGSATNTTQQTADLCSVLLRENKFVDTIISEFSFIEYYQLPESENLNESLRNIYKGNIVNSFTLTTNILTISYKDLDNERATKIVNRIVELLEIRFRSLILEKISEKNRFLNERMIESYKEFQIAKDNLIKFQKEYGIIDISAQANGTIQQIIKLQAQITQLELEEQQLLEYYTANDPIVVRKRKEISQVKDLLNEYQTGFKTFSSQIIPQNILPDISAEYYNLQQEITVKGSIYKMLREQYEASRIEEKDNTAMFQILEKAEILKQKSGPSRGLMVIIVTFIGFIFGVFISFIKDYFERVKNNPVENQKMLELKENLSFFKKKKI